MKKFRRIQRDKMFAGVCTGLAHYFNIDVTLIRVLFVVTALFTALPLLLYIIIAILAPKSYELE